MTARKVKAPSVHLERLEVVWAKVGELRPNDYNPNRQDAATQRMLRQSIREDGFTQPIVATKDGVIVDGEHRWIAAQDEGMAQVPVVYVDMTEAQRRISTIRHNKARGSHDVALDAALLRDLDKLGAGDWARDALAIDTVSWQTMVDDIPAPDLLAGDDYSQAWEPGGAGADGDVADTTHGSTADAVKARRAAEAQAAKAKTTDARERARKEAHLYRLSLTFSGDEGQLVKSVLGDNPATALLALCRDKLAACDAPTATKRKPASRSSSRKSA